MKKVKVNAYQRGLVFKNGVFQYVLSEGSYWFWGSEQVLLYERTQPFHAPVDLNILVKDEKIADELEVVEVKDNEIALQFENGLLKAVLGPGRYAFWKGIIDYVFIRVDISRVEIPQEIDRSLLQHRLLAPYVRSYEIQSYEEALLFVDGKFAGRLAAGTYFWWKNGISIHVARADTRQQQMEVNGQEILTRDKAALRVNAWAQYRVVDIEKAMVQNKEHERQLYVSFQLALREYIGGLGFDELLEKKESMKPYVLNQVREKAVSLGVEVLDFGIRDIILPGDVKEIMNSVLIAEKKAQANTITRREETASTRSLLNTAKLMEDNAMLWKLKEMEYVEKIADKISNISVGGNGVLIEQLKEIFISKK